MNAFLERVRTEMDYQGLTQVKLAQMTEISVYTIRGWFSKDLVPDVFSALKVSKALDLPIEYLALGEASKPIYKIPDDLLAVMKKYVN